MSEYRRGLAFAAGKKAALAGKPAATNNRQRGTIFYDDWADGHEEGEREKRQFAAANLKGDSRHA